MILFHPFPQLWSTLLLKPPILEVIALLIHSSHPPPSLHDQTILHKEDFRN